MKRNRLRVLALPAFHNRAQQPYNWLLYTGIAKHRVEVTEFSWREALRGRFDILHLHWPEGVLLHRSSLRAFAACVRLLLFLTVCKVAAKQVVWTVHNLRPHERHHPVLEKAFATLFPRLVTAIISLSKTGEDLVLAKYPSVSKCPRAIIPLGHYRDVYPERPGRDVARRALGLGPDARVMLYFGGVRPYKNVDGLLEAFAECRRETDTLIVAGSAGTTDKARLQAMGKNARVVFFLDHVPDEQVPALFAASDLTVLPYADVLNSSAALLSLSFNVPVLVPNVGAIPDLQRAVGASWVHTFNWPLTSTAILSALHQVRASVRPEAADLQPFSWPEIARGTVDFYSALLRDSGRRSRVVRASSVSPVSEADFA